MIVVGYVNALRGEEYKEKQVSEIMKQNVSYILFENENPTQSKKTTVIDDIVTKLKSGDKLVVYELFSLWKTTNQLSDFINRIKKSGIILVVLKKENSLLNEIKDDILMDVILEISDVDDRIKSELVRKGIQKATLSGKKSGRPRLTEIQINKIRALYSEKKMPLREIAELTNVSLGTVHKYTRDMRP